MPKKPKPKSPTPEVYQVEVIIAARVNSEGEWEYLVKWDGYGEADNSWEPQENLQECVRLLRSFWEHIGIDNNDYPLGYQVKAKPAWIEKEKGFFAKEFREKQAEKDKQKQAESKNKTKKISNTKSAVLSSNTKGKAKPTSKPSPRDSDGERPLMAAIFSKPKSTITIPPKKRLRVISDDSDSEDTQPPRKVSKTGLSVDTTKQPGPSTSTAVDNGTTEDAPSSPNSLFSDDSSTEQPKSSLTKTSSKPQPKVKLMDIPRNLAQGSALSTKQRILQGAASGSKPKPKVPPINVARRPSLGLGFKKTPMSNPSHTASGSKTKQGSLFVDSNEITASPVSYDLMQDSIPHADDHLGQNLSPEARIDMSPPPLPSESRPVVDTTTVDEFLNDILPPPPDIPMDMSEPMPEPVSDEPVVPRSLTLPRPIPEGLKKIPKKWKWTGDLFLNNTPDHAEKLCTVVLSDATDSSPDSLRFSILFASMDSIRFTKLLNVGDLVAVLPACKPIQQLAKLRADSNSDADTIRSLATFMDKNRQIALTPLFLDHVEVASMVVFPSTLQTLCRLFKVPSDMQQGGDFVAAVIPWTLSPSEHSEYGVHKITLDLLEPKHPPSHATQLLEFPRDLRMYMSQPGRTYCVWWSPGDGTTANPGLETNQLHAIMKSCKAKHVGHKMDVRVVFVHVGALVTLHRLPALAERRGKRPEINFYTYGTHADVPRERWGVFPIYPLGGIVTFTPDALLEDPIGAAQLMRQTSMHPFWDCYLLPSVIGMAAKSSCEGDPLSAFKAGNFPLHDIINLVADGDVSLLEAPPVHGHDPQMSWMNSQLELFSLNASSLLEKCLSIFSTQYTNAPVAQLSTVVDTEISKDLLHMQVQPSIMENYRRFVIITASTSQADANKDGFEWITLAKFDFKDNFFDKSEHPVNVSST